MKLDKTPFAPLAVYLIDLLHRLEKEDIPLIIVGGFGLFLRREYRLQTNARTLYADVPALRSTEDFDVILTLSLLADATKVHALREALNALGYRVVPGAEKYQFLKSGTAGEGRRDVKVDLLAREPDAERGDPALPFDSRRVKPGEKNNPLHARRTPEAIAAEDNLLAIPVEGLRSDATSYQGIVYLPHPYALLLMKLFAFRDEETGNKGVGREPYARKHALDLYTLAALMTDEEYTTLSLFRSRYGAHPVVREAGTIVRDFFSTPTHRGVVRLREATSTLERLTDLLALLSEMFPLEEQE
jgi:hypothetical protein